MYPLICEDDLVFVQPVRKELIRLGDMLVYKSIDTGTTIAHRLVKINQVKARQYYILRGDFAKDTDRAIAFDDILGKVVALKRDNKLINLEGLPGRILKFIWNKFPWLGGLIFPLLKWRSICFKWNLKLNPKFFIKPPHESLLIVQNKFNRLEEVKFHSEYVNSGLEEWEGLAIEKYLKKNARILNIGCGAGREAIALAKLGFEVAGIDIAPEMIREAKKNAERLGLNIRFEAMSATEIEFPEKSFDYCLFSRAVYSFIASRRLRIDTLSRIKRCLIPGGLIFLSAYVIKNKLLSLGNIFYLFRKVRNNIFPFFSSEPGDVWIRSVSPQSRTDIFCFCHFFNDGQEILKEVKGAGLEAIEGEIEDIYIAKVKV